MEAIRLLMTVMEAIRPLMTVFPLALTSGINLYATVCVVGLSIRFEWVRDTPVTLNGLRSPWVIGIAGVLYIIEFIVDKFDFFDNAWDLIHTFIRPVGAVWIALHLLGQADPMIEAIGFLLAGGVALGTHASKAGVRLGVSMEGEPLSTIGVSVGEDVVAVTLAYFALRHPIIASTIAAVIVVLTVIYLPRFVRWGFYMPKVYWARIKSWVTKKPPHDQIPLEHMPLLGHIEPKVFSACKVQKLAGVHGRIGYVSISDDTLSFTYTKWFRHRKWSIGLAEIAAAYVRGGWLVDRVELHFSDAKGKSRLVRFIFTKDRKALFEAISERVGAKDAAVRNADLGVSARVST